MAGLEVLLDRLDFGPELLPLRLQGRGLHFHRRGFASDLLQLSLKSRELLAQVRETSCNPLCFLVRPLELLRDRIELPAIGCAESHRGFLEFATHHRPAWLDELAGDGNKPDAAHVLASLVERFDNERVAEDVEERVTVLLVELDQVDCEADGLLRNEDCLSPRPADEHLTEREERGPPRPLLLKEVNARRCDPVIVDDDRLHSAPRCNENRRFVLRLHMAELCNRAMDALDRSGVSPFEDCRDGGRVTALHVLGDVRFGPHRGVLSRELDNRVLELSTLTLKFRLFLTLCVKLLLELREGFRARLRAGPEFLQLELGVVELELVRLQDL